MRRQLIELRAEHPPEGKQPLDHPGPDLIKITIVIIDACVTQKRDPTRPALVETGPLKLGPKFAFDGLPSLHQPVEEGLVPIPVGVVDVDLHAGASMSAWENAWKRRLRSEATVARIVRAASRRHSFGAAISVK